jgi:hypothetical protein
MADSDIAGLDTAGATQANRGLSSMPKKRIDQLRHNILRLWGSVCRRGGLTGQFNVIKAKSRVSYRHLRMLKPTSRIVRRVPCVPRVGPWSSRGVGRTQ